MADQPGSEITSDYRIVADRLIGAATSDHQAWERLAHLTDYYPRRLSGSQMLEDAIDWSVNKLKEDGIPEVRTQEVQVPHWVRGVEYARVLSPVPMELPMLGLGGSVGTGGSPIRAEVLIVSSFEDLERRADEASGRIVVWNVPFTDYGATVQYRARGAIDRMLAVK